jgi:hypothetical protein
LSPAPDEQQPDSRAELLRKFREIILKHRPHDVSGAPDAKYAAEKLDLEEEQKKAEIGGTVQDIKERKKYAHRSFCLVAIWLVSIGVMIIFQGFKIKGFNLEPEVLMALIGGTTTGIVGIFLIVSRYLFPRRH